MEMFGAPPDDADDPTPSLTATALWNWLMKHGTQDWHTTAERLTAAFTITAKEPL